MANEPEKDVAAKERKGVVKEPKRAVEVVITASWSFIKGKWMSEDHVLTAATEFEKRLKAGEVKLLSPEESDRTLGAIREQQKVIRKKFDEILKK
jgi:hypothetical protein